MSAVTPKIQEKNRFQFLNLCTLKITDFEIFVSKIFWADGVKGITFFLKNDNRALEEVPESLEKDGFNEHFN